VCLVCCVFLVLIGVVWCCVCECVLLLSQRLSAAEKAENSEFQPRSADRSAQISLLTSDTQQHTDDNQGNKEHRFRKHRSILHMLCITQTSSVRLPPRKAVDSASFLPPFWSSPMARHRIQSSSNSSWIAGLLPRGGRHLPKHFWSFVLIPPSSWASHSSTSSMSSSSRRQRGCTSSSCACSTSWIGSSPSSSQWFRRAV